MIFLDYSSSAHILLSALILDALIGDPAWIYTRISHPVAWIGKMISWSEQHFNRETRSNFQRRLLGALTIIVICVITSGVSSMIVVISQAIPVGWLVLSLVVSIFLAQRSLYEHVAAVADTLTQSLDAGRIAVARIVGRNTQTLDQAGVARAAIESCAESFSDGIVAPIFWYVVGGLPGLVIYKTVNTADSMIGYRTQRYHAFGWIAARLDDVMNIIPSRVASILLGLATFLIYKGIHRKAAWAVTWYESNHHPSPNAGWPEATIAGALNRALAGPRHYGTDTIEYPWLNAQASPIATIQDIRLALRLVVRAIGILWFCIIGYGMLTLL